MEYKKRKVINYMNPETRCSTHEMLNAIFFFERKWYCEECRNKLVAELNLTYLAAPLQKIEEEIRPKIEKVGGESG